MLFMRMLPIVQLAVKRAGSGKLNYTQCKLIGPAAFLMLRTGSQVPTPTRRRVKQGNRR